MSSHSALIFFEVIDEPRLPEVFSIGGGDEDAPVVEAPTLPEPPVAPPEECAVIAVTPGLADAGRRGLNAGASCYVADVVSYPGGELVGSAMPGRIPRCGGVPECAAGGL